MRETHTCSEENPLCYNMNMEKKIAQKRISILYITLNETLLILLCIAMFLSSIYLFTVKTQSSKQENYIPINAELTDYESKQTSTYLFLEVRYKYRYNETPYTNNSVGIRLPFDHKGSSLSKYNRKLKQAYLQGKNVNCLIDPVNPEKSVLFSKFPIHHYRIYQLLSWWLILACIGGVRALHVRKNRHKYVLEQLKSGHTMPWETNPLWMNKKVINMPTPYSYFGIRALTLISLNLWIIPYHFMVYDKFRDPNTDLRYIWLLIPFFAVCSLLDLYTSWKYDQQLHHSHLKVDTWPGREGGLFRGVFMHFTKNTPTEYEFRLNYRKPIPSEKYQRTKCQGYMWQGIYKQTISSQQHKTFPIQRSFEFKLPKNLSSTEDKGAFWELLVNYKALGVSKTITYQIPIFPAEETNTSIEKSKEEQLSILKTNGIKILSDYRYPQMIEVPGGERIKYILNLFILLCIGIFIGFISDYFSLKSGLGMILAGGIILFSIGMYFQQLIYKTRLYWDKRSLLIEKKHLLKKGTIEKIDRENIRLLIPSPLYYDGIYLHYKIVLYTKNEQCFDILNSFRDYYAARALCNYVHKELGIEG